MKLLEHLKTDRARQKEKKMNAGTTGQDIRYRAEESV